jgi:phenylacetate-CoA ligase
MQPGVEILERSELAKFQQDRFLELLDEILPRSDFYAEKFESAGLKRKDIAGLEDLPRLPFTTKAELLADQEAHPPYGRNLTYPLTCYRRLHQTSGTTGRTLRWLDTADSWNRLLGTWETFFYWLEVTEKDRLFFPFSFGPFLGFWTAFEAAAQRGCLCLSGGGMSSVARLHMLLENQATLVLCTPTYALRLAEVARENGISLGNSVRALIVAGEPGGSIPATRARIEQAWQARVFDHAGSTEAGPMAFECPENPCGLHVIETAHLVEVIDLSTREAKAAGEVGEMVVTTLGRWGSPLIRYRTGDLVRLDSTPCPCGRTFVRLEGGILGRTDDMIHLRGNNVFPAALEGVIRRFDVGEYRIRIDQSATLAELRIEVEPATDHDPGLAERISQTIRDELLFRAKVTLVPPGSLPRFEMKANRIHQE